MTRLWISSWKGSIYVCFGIVTAFNMGAMLWNVSLLYIKDYLYIYAQTPTNLCIFELWRSLLVLNFGLYVINLESHSVKKKHSHKKKLTKTFISSTVMFHIHSSKRFLKKQQRTSFSPLNKTKSIWGCLSSPPERSGGAHPPH